MIYICKLHWNAVLKCKELSDEIGSMNPIISSEPSSVEAYVVKKKTKDKANELMEGFKERQGYIRTLSLIMDDNGWSLPDNLKAMVRMLKDAIPLLESNIQISDGKEEEETKRFIAQVGEGNFLLIYICNFHVLSHLLLIYMCKLHWNLNTMFVCQVISF